MNMSIRHITETQQAVSFHRFNPTWPSVHDRMGWSLGYNPWVLFLNLEMRNGNKKLRSCSRSTVNINQ